MPEGAAPAVTATNPPAEDEPVGMGVNPEPDPTIDAAMAPTEPAPNEIAPNEIAPNEDVASGRADAALDDHQVVLPDRLWAIVAVQSITVEFPDPHALVVLREIAEPGRELCIPIGLPEATALGYAWRQVPTPRPLTHQLFAEVLTRLATTIEVVRLTGRRDGVLTAEFEISSPRGRETVPCRPTDGLTLALRQGVKAPILVDERLFDPNADIDPVPPGR